MGSALVSGIIVGGIYGLIAIGIVLVYKGSRVLNFAQGEIGTIALYIAWWVIEVARWPWVLGALAGIATSMALSFVFERLVVSRMVEATRLAVAVATVGFALLLVALEFKLWGASPKFLTAPIEGQGPKILGFFVQPTQIVALVAVAVIGLGLTRFLRTTDFGLGVLAAAQDPVSTRLVGVRFARVSAFTWVTAGALSAIAALLITPTLGAFAPNHITASFFVPALAAALVGGLTSLTGAFFGGLIVGVITEEIRFFFVASTIPGIPTIAIFALVLLVLLLRPQGLFARGTA